MGIVSLPLGKESLVKGNTPFPKRSLSPAKRNVIIPKGKRYLGKGIVLFPLGKMSFPKGIASFPKGKMFLAKGNVIIPKGKECLGRGKGCFLENWEACTNLVKSAKYC